PCYARPQPERYTLSLHDALPISLSFMKWVSINKWRHRAAEKWPSSIMRFCRTCISLAHALSPTCRYLALPQRALCMGLELEKQIDRKSTRLNSSHQIISYAVFCL